MLTQQPAVPWRVWHFRLPMAWHESMTKNPGRPLSDGWTLYHFNREARTMTQQPVPAVDDWPTRVPGM